MHGEAVMESALRSLAFGNYSVVVLSTSKKVAMMVEQVRVKNIIVI